MTATFDKAPVSAGTATVDHPLEPLSPSEVAAAVALVKQAKSLSKGVRFMTVTLQEPPKSVVFNFKPGDAIDRQAYLVLLDNTTGQTSELVVSVTHQLLLSEKMIPNAQHGIVLDEFLECEAAVKASPEFQAALRKRGITDSDLVMVDPWSAGHYGIAEEEGVRLSRALCWVRSSPTDNGYARPVDGIVIVVDLNKMQVIRVEDYGMMPLPPEPGNYAPEFVKNYRTDLKPLEIVQPEGPSFQVKGHEIAWQKWRMRVGFTPREGLVLHTVTYNDQGQERPVLYRASLVEMTVPYGDPRPFHYRKNAFDVGEYGVGTLANSLKLGCDCLGEIYYFDGVLTNSLGDVAVIENAICLHEEDFGILWKHVDWRTEQAEVRRSRRLVVSFIATVGNYEYGYYWYFYQDGTIQYEIKLTGIMNTAGALPDEKPQFGTLVAPQLYAPNHQHFFSVRLDMAVDGPNNSVYEVNTAALPIGPDNPHGNAFAAQATLLETEQQAQRVVDPFAGRYWKIVNPSKTNWVGEPVGYKLMPGENILPFAHPESSVYQRGAYMTKHLWVTPFQSDQRFPAGEYPNQHPGGAGLPAWTAANRPITDTDVVVWYTMGHLHIPRAEDWPVMPVSYLGFMLKPVNFFNENPANDVPPSRKHKCHG
jgi:primary-amine oxidase